MMVEKDKKVLCNKEMNKFIMNNFYKNNNNKIKTVEEKIDELNIKENNKNKSENEKLDIISILLSLINFTD